MKPASNAQKQKLMKVLNDYECPNGHFKEYFVENSVTSLDCLECGQTATKVRSVPNFQLPGNDPAGFPTAYDQWNKKREQKMAQETKAENS